MTTFGRIMGNAAMSSGKAMKAIVTSLLCAACLTLGANQASAQAPVVTPNASPNAFTPIDLSEGGLKVHKNDVLFGKPKRSSQPAEVDLKVALAATPEGIKIEEEGIEKGSARYRILVIKGIKRVRKAIKDVAVQEGRDCVIKKGCRRTNPGNLTIEDLTDKVVAALK